MTARLIRELRLLVHRLGVGSASRGSARLDALVRNMEEALWVFDHWPPGSASEERQAHAPHNHGMESED